MIPGEKPMDVEQVRGLLGEITAHGRSVSHMTLWRRMKAGMPRRRIGRALIFYKSEVTEWVNSQKEGVFIQ